MKNQVLNMFMILILTLIIIEMLPAQSNDSIMKTSDLTDGLIAYYPFNGNPNDESGNGNDGINNGAVLTTDRFGNENSAYHFDGIQSYIDIGNNLKPDLPATVSGWVYLDSLNYTILFRNDRTDGCQYYNGLQIETSDGRLTGWIGCGYAGPSTRRHKTTNDTVFTKKTWHHFTVVFTDMDTINLYVDGKEYNGDWGNGTGSKIRYSSSYNGALGMRYTCGKNQYFLKGSLDNIRIYNRTLSQNEICQLYYENGWKEDETVTDIDGNIYRTVKIGDQAWMAENLKVTRYRNGDKIPHITDDSEWAGLNSGAYCAYDNDDTNTNTYGLLYNWYAVNDDRKIAPEGWHVATDEEWKQLEMFLGMSQSEANNMGWRGTDEGGKMKATGTVEDGDGFWHTPNTGATNEVGFAALPGGFRFKNGTFYRKGEEGDFWSATKYNSSDAWGRYLYYRNSDVYLRNYANQHGFSIRCIKDNSNALTLTSPKGGENWTTDSQHEITWTAGDSIRQVKIEYSSNGGSTWNEIVSSIDAIAGSYLWTVPDVFSDDCLIKVSKASDAEIFDESSAFRTYIPETVIITHGFTFDYGNDDIVWGKYKWQFSMADAISPDRQILLFRKGKIYQTNMIFDEFKNIDDDTYMDALILNTSKFTSELSLEFNRNTAIVFDWQEESDINTHGYAEAAADVLAASLINLAKQYPWIVRNLHFIGHSRGTVVNSEAIERLIYFASNNDLPDEVQEEFDKDIHMTTLDAHPAGHWTHLVAMNDDWVNSMDIKVFDVKKNDSVRVGVSGWKGEKEKYYVGYMDNYYHPKGSLSSKTEIIARSLFFPFNIGGAVGIHFRGLNNIPGITTGGNNSLENVFDGIDILLGTHSQVHTWYFGTVNYNADYEEFNDPESREIRRANWYIDTKGEKEGFIYSDIRSVYKDSVKANIDNLYFISKDKNFGKKFLLINGDFEKSGTLSSVGWEYQGGGGTAAIADRGESDNLITGTFPALNYFLLLNNQGNWREHNYFYVPNNTGSIFFRRKVVKSSSDDRFLVLINDKVELDKGLKSTSDEPENLSIDVRKYQNTIIKIKFIIMSPGGDIESEVYVDDVSFIESQYMNATVATNNTNSKFSISSTNNLLQLHAYDNFGNHTGPTSDSTFVEEIPGSHYFAEPDSIPNARKSIRLPKPAEGVHYTYKVKSNGTTGKINMRIDDFTNNDAKTSTFENIQIEENSIISTTLSEVDTSTILNVDLDGDGSADSVITASNYFENVRIYASTDGNGKISPSDTIIVNYGDSLKVDIVPDSGYAISNVWVDDDSIGNVENYTFYNITSPHKIYAEFSEATGIKESETVPFTYYIRQNYPNPFNPVTNIKFGLPLNSNVKVDVYNSLGQKIQTLMDKKMSAGNYTIKFDGSALSSGIYFYKIQAGNFVKVKKMLLIK